MSLADELQRLAAMDRLDSARLHERRALEAEHDPAAYRFSPAIGEYAVTATVPELLAENKALRDSVDSLTLDLDRANVLIETLRGNLRTFAAPNGAEGW